MAWLSPHAHSGGPLGCGDFRGPGGTDKAGSTGARDGHRHADRTAGDRLPGQGQGGPGHALGGARRVKFEDAVALRTGDDTEIAPAVEQAKGGGHHREAVLVFPPLAQAAALRIVVKGVGGVPERNFSWELPSAR